MTQPPLPAQTAYWSDPNQRQRVVNTLFDRSARHYDAACDIMSLGSGRRYRRAALQRGGVQAGLRVLDVGTGTGLVAREAHRLVGPTGRVVGIDPSRLMMTATNDGRNLRLVQGVAERLPFADGTFDVVTMGYALRHVPDLDETFREYRRVLKPGGRVLLLEITRPASPVGAVLARAYFGTIVPWLARIGTGSAAAGDLMRFYWNTIANCVAPEVVLASLRRAGFAAQRSVVGGLFSEYAGTAISASSPSPTH